MKIIRQILLLAVTAAFLQVHAQNTGFTGNWKINLAKSEFNDAPSYTLSKAFDIMLTPSTTTIRRTNIADSGADSLSFEISGTDGKNASLKNAGGFKEFKIGRSPDGKKLIETFTYAGGEDDLTFEGTETFALSEDGKVLFVTKYVKNSTGFEYTVKGWYDRAAN